MAHAGGIACPTITPLRYPSPSLPSSYIGVNTYIELAAESPNCKLYFTTDGSKPTPFQRKIGGRETTFRYIGPFTLKPGKRTLKAVAVSRDGLQESAMVTRTFNVRDISDEITTDDYDYTSYSSFFETSDSDTVVNSGSSAASHKSKNKNKSQTLKNKKTGIKEAWAIPGHHNKSESGAFSGSEAAIIPDGPFNPVNYSGTQINVWGGPPPGAWPGNASVNPGMITIGNGGPPLPPYPVQYGFLTEQMIQGLNENNRPVTVGDLRNLMLDNKQPPPPKPAIEYRPTYQDPPVNAVSPGNGECMKHVNIAL